MSEFHAANFYDAIADKYNWFFSSRDKIIERQASQIIPVLEKFDVKTILDCSCGDGLQAIPLFKLGYLVDGGDISANMIKKAVEHSNRENLKINFKQADFRELEKTFTKTYDCVLSMGNAVPHLMTDKDITMAVSSIYNRINPSGIALIEMENYEKALTEKKKFHPMRINDIQDNFRYSLLYVFDYLPNIVRYNIVYLIENMQTGEKTMEQESVDYNPIKQADFISHLKKAGFVNVEVADAGYGNSIYIAQK